MQAELEQVDFFLAQAMLDEAMSMLTDLQSRYPATSRWRARWSRSSACSSLRRDTSGAVCAGRRRLDELDWAVTMAPAASAIGQGRQRRRRHSRPLRSLDPEPHEPSPEAVVAGGEKVDLATHGDLGIAYKEMGLLDAAIGEF